MTGDPIDICLDHKTWVETVFLHHNITPKQGASESQYDTLALADHQPKCLVSEVAEMLLSSHLSRCSTG
jgi:hypothetical protein